METKLYSPFVLMFLALFLAVIYAVKFFTENFPWYNLVAFLLFAAAAATSFIRKMDLHLGWYLYIASFAFWIILQIIVLFEGGNVTPGGILNVVPYILVGLFILFYLFDTEVKNTFTLRFSFKR